MKLLKKITLVAASAALFVSSAALADDSQQKQQLERQQAKAQRDERPSTIAAYGTWGVGNAGTVGRAEVRLERHDVGRGTYYVYRPSR